MDGAEGKEVDQLRISKMRPEIHLWWSYLERTSSQPQGRDMKVSWNFVEIVVRVELLNIDGQTRTESTLIFETVRVVVRKLRVTTKRS